MGESVEELSPIPNAPMPCAKVTEEESGAEIRGRASMETKKVVFDPYAAIAANNGESANSGINWSYAKFLTQRDMAVFIAECNNHGYRTRNDYKQGDSWFVQYHHYED